MDLVHTIDSDKPHQKHGSIDQLREENLVEFGTLDNPDDLLTESRNGLFHKDDTPEESPIAHNVFVDEQLSHHDVTHKSETPAVDFLNDKNFCGTQDLRENPTDLLVNDDVEFIPSHVKESQASLLDFEPPSTRSEIDEFQAHPGRPKDDIIEPAADFKESVPIDNLISIDSKDDKFKELTDSLGSGTSGFLELRVDPDDIKPIAQNIPEKLPEPVKPIEAQKAPEKLPEPVKPIEMQMQKTPEKLPEPVKPIEVQKAPEKVAEPVKPVEVPKTPEPAATKPAKKPEYDKPEIGPKEIFSKYGLVEAFIYWRDPKLSAIVFVSGLVLLLSMAYYSLISVVANTGLTILVCAMGFRVYKHVLQAVQKTDQAHPYSVFLDWDIKLPQEKVHELLDTVLIHINAYLGELRRLFLVENWIESIKFAVVLWVLTYVGSWFNGLTLVIFGFVSLFTLPKVYENNKVQIDQNLALVHVKLEELTNKIKDTLPALLRKKVPEKKE